MSDSHSEWSTRHREEDGVLIVEALKEVRFRGFDGETRTKDIVKRRLKVEADEDLARKLGHEFMDFVAQKSPTGPPGQKPMHQQYAEVEPDR